jgi:hypothetical protein
MIGFSSYMRIFWSTDPGSSEYKWMSLAGQYPYHLTQLMARKLGGRGNESPDRGFLSNLFQFTIQQR